MKGSIKFLRLPEVIQKVGFKKTHIYNLMAKDLFPKQITIGRRAVVWNEYEIDQWQEGYIK